VKQQRSDLFTSLPADVTSSVMGVPVFGGGGVIVHKRDTHMGTSPVHGPHIRLTSGLDVREMEDRMTLLG
jgi:hypothetical protein